MDYELDETHEQFRCRCSRLRHEGDRAARRAVGRRAHVPGRRRARHGRARAVRPAVPRGVRRRRCRPHDAVHRDRGDRPGRQLAGDHARGRCVARRRADPPLRVGGAETGVAAPPVRRRGARCIRSDRTGRRLRRRRHPHQGRARRRGLGDQRREGVHHQLRHRDHGARHRHCPHGSRSRSRPSSCRPVRQGSRSSRRTARWAGTPPTRTVSRSTTAGCPSRTCSASVAAASPSSSTSSTRDGVAIAALVGRHDRGVSRRIGPVRVRAPHVRPPDRGRTRGSRSRSPTWR